LSLLRVDPDRLAAGCCPCSYGRPSPAGSLTESASRRSGAAGWRARQARRAREAGTSGLARSHQLGAGVDGPAGPAV